MNELLKYYAFIFIALRVLVDLVVSVIIYYQTKAFVVGIASVLGCSVFSFLLYRGIRNEEFLGRHGHRVNSNEPLAYWFVVAFLVLFHLVVTGLMIRIIHW